MKILIVDDDKMKRIPLRDDLEESGYDVAALASSEEALEYLEKESADVIVTDMKMPGMDGIEFLEKVKAEFPKTTVIMMTAYGTVETAVRAMKLGAYDYITKPFENQELILVLERVKEFRDLVEENIQLRRRLEDRYQFHSLIGKSHVMQEIFDLLDTVASSDSTVLICGETGTGKELAAQAIHSHSPRAKGPFIKVSCAALSKELLESELFGHEKGAFTGAIREKIGKVQLAHRGTILFDEVDDIPYELQVKLLRVLEERSFERVGGTSTIKVDTRVIAATKVDLKQKVADGQFRKDLFYRLNVVPINLPPLRERKEDIPLLIEHFLGQFSPQRSIEVHPEAMKVLLSYSWPGNVRELENLIERLVVVGKGKEVIKVSDLPPDLETPILPKEYTTMGNLSFFEIIESVEKDLLLQALQKTGWNKTKAAETLNMKLTTFWDKLTKYGLEYKKSV